MARLPQASTEDTKTAEKTGPRVREIVLGSCRTAALIEGGVVGSSVPAEDWHAQCKGGHVSETGRVTICTCACHNDRPACIECGSAATDLDDNRRCLDREGCLETLRAGILGNPRTAKLEHIAELAAAEKAEKKAEEEQAIATGVRKPRSGKTPQPCQHCGEMTKGGMFVMGHDAKLKGILMRAGEDGDVDSIVELKLRSWFPTTGRGSDRYAAGDVDRADTVVQQVKTDEFLAGRVSERLALIAQGRDPEDAVRDIAELEGKP